MSPAVRSANRHAICGKSLTHIVPTVSDSLSQNSPDHHRLRRGVSKTGTTDRWRFTPYETYHSRPTMHENAEAGPSTQPPPPVPYDMRPTTQPTGGSSEATADAEQTESFTEEDGAPVSDCYCSPVPHVTDCLFGDRHLEASFHVAKGWYAPTVNGIARTYSCCGHGPKLCEGLGCSQATKTRLLVSTYPIL